MILNIEDGINAEIIRKIIEGHGPEAIRMEALYNEYKGSVEITERDFEDETLINKKLANDYRGEIIDQLVGFLVGKPIQYILDTEDEKTLDTIRRFKRINNIETLDMNIVKMASICGKTYRLLYVDENAEVRALNCNPWNIVVSYNPEGEVVCGIYYYTVKDPEGKDVVQAEVYEATHVTVWKQGMGNVFEVVKESVAHHFIEVPIIEMRANEEELGDFEKVGALIDAYDCTMSDAQNEIEEFRQAYQIFTNCTVDAEVKKAARITGAYSIPKNADVKFLTKNINSTFMENHIKTLEENIYRFSKTVNMSDENFSGDAQSGVARKWKLLSLELRATTRQLYMIKCLRDMFRLIDHIWLAKGLDVDYLEYEFKFLRNIPLELKEAAETAEKLVKIVSRRTTLETIPIIEDIEEEIARIEEEEGKVEDLDEMELD